MSEVLNAEAHVSEENGGLSRRRVVAGVAWSLPVIVTAVAAPAAAASGLSVTAELLNIGSAIKYFPSGSTGKGTRLDGTGPTALRLRNTGAAFSGTISLTIRSALVSMIPVGTAATVAAGAGVESMTPATVVASSYSAHEYTGSLSYTAAFASGQTVELPIQFQFETVNPSPKNGEVHSCDLTIIVTLPDRTSQSVATRISVTF